MMNAVRRGRRGTWLAGLGLALAGALPLALAGDIVQQWSQVKVPPPPPLKAVSVEPAATALIVMDISVRTCSAAHRPRCAASLPAIARLVRQARATGVLVLYSLIGHDKRSDIPRAFAARPSDTVLTGAGPDKFLGTDLASILKGKHIDTLITVGTSAEGAVLNTASAAAFQGLSVIVPVDGMSSSTPYGEQSTAWYLAHAPRVSQRTTLTAVDRMKF